jgi:hypothetical protein
MSDFRTPFRLLLFGGDVFFSYFGEDYLSSLEKVMKAATGIHAHFATASEYLDAVLSHKPELALFEGDLVPYITDKRLAWTGYYSTKPFLKHAMYEAQRLVRLAEIYQAMNDESAFMADGLNTCTHHDAITGTCMGFVYDDYKKLTKNDHQAAIKAISKAVFDMVKEQTQENQVMVPFKTMFLINPVNWKVTKTVSVSGKKLFMKIVDLKGRIVETQGVAAGETPEFYFTYTLDSSEIKVLFVYEYDIECLGCSVASAISNNTSISNKNLEVNMKDGFMKEILYHGVLYTFSSQLVRYSTEQSGVYTFVPKVI